MVTPVSRRILLARLAPVAVLSALAATLIACAHPVAATEIALATALMAGALASVLVAPSARALVPPLAAAAYLAGVALLRDACGGIVSGVAPLVMLPVLWQALYGSRAQLAMTIALVSLVFVAPVLLVGGDTYPPSSLRSGLFMAAVAALIGLTTQRLIARVRGEREQARQLQHDLTAQRDFTDAVLDTADALVLVLDPDGRVVRFNHACERLTGLPASDVHGQTLWGHVLDPADRADVEAAFPCLTARDVPDVYENDWIAGDGTRRRIVWRNAVIVDGHGKIAWIVATGVDVTEHRRLSAEREALIEQLSRLAVTDELTGLTNRRGWDERLGVLLKQAARDERPLCVALIDLDNFKAFNDEHGHPEGDRLLQEAASAWRSLFRGTDVVARYGGEEFAIALPACALDAATRLAEQLRSVRPRGQSCSIGLTQWSGREPADALIARADRALYQAKQQGRDRVVALPAPAADVPSPDAMMR